MNININSDMGDIPSVHNSDDLEVESEKRIEEAAVDQANGRDQINGDWRPEATCCNGYWKQQGQSHVPPTRLQRFFNVYRHGHSMLYALCLGSRCV